MGGGERGAGGGMPAAQATATQNTITLKGSTQIVTEFFNYAVNSILFQRGLYDPENFERKKKYGLSLMVTSDDGLVRYLDNVMTQISEWLKQGMLQKLVLVISAVGSKEVRERWTFDIQTDEGVLGGGKAPRKEEKEISKEIQAIIRQITASVTFLPLLDEPCERGRERRKEPGGLD